MDNNRHRDLARTRRRILKAALAEFSAKGLAGARTDVIARRARVNKRMLFYCFGSKAGLYREVLRLKLSARASVLETTPEDFSAALLYWCQAASSDPEWIRLQQWEALGGKKLVAEDERRELFEQALAQFHRWVKQAYLPDGVDLRQLLISLVALAVFPTAFPQLTRLIAGVPPDSPAFLGVRRKFLSWLADRVCETGGLAGGAGGKAVSGPSGPGGDETNARRRVTGAFRARG